jgi:hypothetical protein
MSSFSRGSNVTLMVQVMPADLTHQTDRNFINQPGNR